MKKQLLLVPAYLFVLLACTSEPSNAPIQNVDITITNFAGVWQQGSEPIFMRVDSDGSFSVASSRESFDTNALDVGKLEFDNGTLSFSSNVNSPNCGGQKGTYQVTFIGEDEFETHVIEDECAPFRGDSRVPTANWSKITD